MIMNFKCKHTQALYEGKSPKQFRAFQAQAERKLQMLDSAAELLDLRSPAGNKLKKLGGDRQGQHSIRINKQWRVCFVWSGEPSDVEIADYHPGEIIKEEYLEPLSMSVSALAVALRVPASRINDVVRQKRGVSIDTALRLARYFNTTAQFWMNLQISYDLKIARQNMTIIEDEIIPLQTTVA